MAFFNLSNGGMKICQSLLQFYAKNRCLKVCIFLPVSQRFRSLTISWFGLTLLYLKVEIAPNTTQYSESINSVLKVQLTFLVEIQRVEITSDLVTNLFVFEEGSFY